VRTRNFLGYLDRAIVKECKWVARGTRPLFGLSSVILAEKVQIWRLEVGVVLCVNSKVANEGADVRSCGVLDAVSTLEGDG
jgi:hypothetical protein